MRSSPPAPEQSPVTTAARLPRITRLLALAVRFEGLLQEGTVRDYADLARLGGVSRARITQIMSLRHLHGPNQLITYLLSIHYAEHRRRETADGQRP